ncbi:MAG TPA: AFG1/ZapE family ATPase, partial [Rhizomicrobium sp.]|nr:AFG1/ZapE family ATPase [Rhizomicrobium sp.]
MLLTRYRKAVSRGELRSDPAQNNAVQKLQDVARALAHKPGFSLFRRPAQPVKGLYIWGDVGRGKTLLMDLFFGEVAVAKKRRTHF